MRIQHNISAMNSYRQLGNNNNMLSKNLEKLSSGYRINRAGDDAAGLAISEKMRSQIKGLETAQKNANDGISLVQTAEGALTEVHSMLNRMTELATQSANGTYDNEVDRANLQKEVQALLDEIDRISESTNFNGINLLDGSLGMNTEAFSNITSTAAAAATTAGSVTFTDGEVFEAKDGVNTAVKASFKLDLSALGTTKAAVGGDVTVTIGDYKLNVAGLTTNGDDIATAVKNAIKADTASTGTQGEVKIDGQIYTTTDGETFTMKNDPANGATVTPNFKVTIADKNAGSGVMAGEYIDATTTTTVGQGKTDTKLAEAEFKLDFANIKHGTTLEIAGETYTFTMDGTNGGSNIDLKALGITEDNVASKGAVIASAVAKAAAGNATFTVGADADKLQLMEKAGRGNKATLKLDTVDAVKGQVKMTTAVAAKNATTSVDVDASKMVAGDKLTVDGKTYEFVAEGGKASDNNIAVEVAGLSGKAGTATGDAAKALADAITAQGGTAAADGNKVTVTAASLTDAAPKVGSSGVKLQVGDTAEDFNKVNVKIDSTDAETLGIADIDISTQEGAAAAIEKIKTAINTVSSTRGDLGAVQNRLEHTINNLGVTTENITAAESRIRDTDMASEMMAYTKNNILIQASQAMLAQANQVPQGVLQLLQ